MNGMFGCFAYAAPMYYERIVPPEKVYAKTFQRTARITKTVSKNSRVIPPYYCQGSFNDSYKEIVSN